MNFDKSVLNLLNYDARAEERVTVRTETSFSPRLNLVESHVHLSASAAQRTVPPFKISTVSTSINTVLEVRDH